MTSASLIHDRPTRSVRWSVKPESPTPSGYVDGAWWPRSRELADELPPLLAALAERLGHVERVSHHLGDWAAAPRRIGTGGAAVRVGGYRQQAAGTIDVEGPTRRLTLLVVPPEADAGTADRALATAATAGNALRVPDLLAAAGSG